MTIRTRFALAACACASALALAACGGDSATEAAPPAPPAPPAEPAQPEPAPPAEPPAETPAPAEPTPAEPTPAEPTEPAPAEPAEPAPAEPTLPLADNEVPTPGAVPDGAIAIVGDVAVEKATFDKLIAQREQAVKAQGGEFPAAGTPEYEALKNQYVGFLVQKEQFSQEAAAQGVSVTEDEVTVKLDELKEQFFEGDQKKYQEELEKNSLTEEQVRDDLSYQLLSQKLYDKVVAGISITSEEIQEYYDGHADEFTLPEQRLVAHILVDTKKKAEDIVTQLDAGADFAELAKKSSQDPGTKENGGEYLAVKGQSDQAFEQAAYELETGAISAPVKSAFGWHVIKALEDVEPSKTQELGEVRAQIDAVLKRTKEGTAAQAFVDALDAKYAGKILYATGYEPPADADAAATATETAP
jgi:foldase protein PrsA